MKKFFTGLFLFAVNFYFACFLLGVVAGLCTVFSGPLPPGLALLLPLLAVGGCAVYQWQKSRFSFFSPGEQALGMVSKTASITQRRGFIRTRWPLFVLLLLTLALPGNFLDGLSDEHAYSLFQVLVLALVYYCLYAGTKNFFQGPPSLAAAAMFMASLLLSAAISAYGPQASSALPLLFLTLAGCWLTAWLVYRFCWLSSTP